MSSKITLIKYDIKYPIAIHYILSILIDHDPVLTNINHYIMSKTYSKWNGNPIVDKSSQFPVNSIPK